MKSEATHPGENLYFDERANEDGYFALKEHELIERLKAEFKEAEASKQEKRAQTCPKCSGKLERYNFMDFVLDRCKSCEGIWLDKGELEEILRRAARGPLGAFLDRCFFKNETQTKSY